MGAQTPPWMEGGCMVLAKNKQLVKDENMRKPPVNVLSRNGYSNLLDIDSMFD